MKNEIVTGKPALMKKINKNLIIKLIMLNESMSRTDIAKKTNLAMPTVMRIVEELIDEKLVIELGKGSSSGGRKPSMLALRQDAMFFIGVNIASEITVILSDLGGNIISRWSSKAAKYNSPQKMFQDILNNIQTLIKNSKVNKSLIQGIGIGAPGTDFKHGPDIIGQIFDGWADINIKKWFEDNCEYPVFVENVAKAQALGELWFGYGKNYNNIAYILIDQGVGCGIIQNGNIYYGENGVSGEIGHMIIVMDGKSCYCGNNGCLEMYVSTIAIEKAVNKKHPSNNHISFDDITKLYQDGNANVIEVIESKGKYMGIAISNIINILNPTAIILGGIVPKSFPIFVDTSKKTASKNIFSKKAHNTPIHVSKVKKGNEAMGSVAIVINQSFKGVQI